MKISILYVIFAGAATVVNLLTQEVTHFIYRSVYQLEISILLGTTAGLLIKYHLDKRYIFNLKAENKLKDVSMFFSYSLMGVITTLIFWATEYSFDYFFGTKTMRYTGAVLGLGIGYMIKYRLDKQYVFMENK